MNRKPEIGTIIFLVSQITITIICNFLSQITITDHHFENEPDHDQWSDDHFRSFQIILSKKNSTYFLSRKNYDFRLYTPEEKNLEKIIFVHKKLGKNGKKLEKIRLWDSHTWSKNDLKWSRSFTIIYKKMSQIPITDHGFKNEPDHDHLVNKT